MIKTMATTTTDDHKNSFRLVLVRRKIDVTLQNKVHERFPRDPVSLYQEFDRLRPQIEEIRKKKIFSKEDFDLLLPASGRCDSSKYYASLLRKILFNFCGYKKALTKPKENDRSPDANIYRLFEIRSKIQAAPIPVSEPIYQEILKNTELPLIELGCPLSDIRDISAISIVDEEAKNKMEKLEESYKKFSNNILPPVSNFMGRDEEIDQIHRTMVSVIENTKITYRILGVVVSGMSSVGKSELVRQYWRQYHNTYYEGIIMWINAQSVDSITNSFMEIGEGIGITMKQPNGSYQPISIIVQEIYNHFVMRKTSEPKRRVLFVFDNLNNPDDIKSFLPVLNNAPYFIVTSQTKNWSSRFEFMELTVFSPQTAEAFLRENTNKVILTNQDASEKLLRELGGHPLAIHQAVSYMKMHNMTVESYLTLFQKHCDQLLLTRQDINSKPVLTEILQSIENFMQRQDSQVAIDLLNLSAYLDGKVITKGLLLMFRNGNVLELNQALSLLSEYSFFSHQISQDFETNFEKQILTVHPLIQFALKYDHNRKQQTEEHLQRILDVFFKHLSEEKQIVNEGKYWFNHYVYLFDSKDTKEIVLRSSMTKQPSLFHLFERKGRLNKFLEILRSIETHIATKINSLS